MLAFVSCASAWAASITSFSPSFGQPGNVVSIFGSGLSGANVVEFNNNNPTVGDFNVVSDSELQVVVPIGATTGELEVLVGSTELLSAANFNVAPVVTNFSPNIGTSPTIIAIFGANFASGGTTVFFTGTNTPVNATFVASTEVEATVPPGAATGPITVITSAGTNVSTNIFTSGTLPVITGFSPTSGAAGATVIISGANFFSPVGVKFNGLAANAAVTSTTEITTTVPSGATSGPIFVSTSAGSATTSSNFSTGTGPEITDFSPTVGNSSTAVTIDGFNLTAATITFNGKAGSITANSSTQIQAYPPSGAGTGPIKISNSTGSFTTGSNFSAPSGPMIADFSPTLGPVGSIVTIDGINFSDVTSVKFGNASTNVHPVSDSQISATVPSGATTGPITVSGSSGTNTTSTNFTVTTSAPAVTGFTPTYGARGSTVTVSGANFSNLASPAVEFNGIAASYQTPTSTTELTATVPAGAMTGLITVNNSSGSGTSAALFYLQPWITSLATNSGIVGSTLVINGRSLTNASSVTVNGLNYAFTNSLTQIGAIVPTNATTGLIEITTPGGIFISTNVFVILPKVYSFTPNFGPAGTIVTINGTSLFNVSSVEFGGYPATPISVSTNQVQVAVPLDAASGPITVFTPYGNSVSSNSFTATKSSLLVLTKSVSPTITSPGADVTYTLTVTNEGPSITTSLIVTDSVPNGLTIVSSNATTGGITLSNGNLFWTFPILSNNASETMHVIATTSAPSSVTNTANLGFAEGNLNVDDNFAYAIAYFLSAQQKSLSVGLVPNTNKFYLSWPVSGVGFVLQGTSDLTLMNGWQELYLPVYVNNGVNYVTDTIAGPTQFYRLFFP